MSQLKDEEKTLWLDSNELGNEELTDQGERVRG